MQEILWLQQRNLGWFVYIVLLAQHIGIVQIKQTNGAFGLELKRLLAFFCFSPPLPPPAGTSPVVGARSQRILQFPSLPLPSHPGKSHHFCFLKMHMYQI